MVISDSFQIRRNHTPPQGQCPHPLKLPWCSLRGLPSSLPLCIPIRLHVEDSPSVYTGLCSTSLSSACFRLKLPKSHQPTLSDGTCLGNGTTHSGQVFSLPSNNQDNSQRPVSQVILDSAKLTINSNFFRSFQQDRRGIRVGLDMTDTSDYPSTPQAHLAEGTGHSVEGQPLLPSVFLVTSLTHLQGKDMQPLHLSVLEPPT